MGTTVIATGALERAILRTLLYSDLFDYPLTPEEVAHYLSGVPSTADEVRACLARTHNLADRVVAIDGYLALRGREALIARRLVRAASSDRLWQRARRFVRVLRLLPFVRMLAITGALSMNNSTAGDDIDVLIVTAPHRVWLTRACAVALVYVGKLCGDTLCPNYVISEQALTLERRTLFTAHEFAQMVPVYGRCVYDQMCAANRWIQTLLPNAVRPLRSEPDQQPGFIGCTLKRGLERLLAGRLGDALEAWEMRRKIRKFQRKLARPDGDAMLDRDHVKGHFDDYGGPVMRLYAERLTQFES
ncbi:hypothetical protein TFLX_02817 [Thermoflexales bacterium]|nr:hypothetical protein TFLX_02817 [Thermoflexales bacterium]